MHPGRSHPLLTCPDACSVCGNPLHRVSSQADFPDCKRPTRLRGSQLAYVASAQSLLSDVAAHLPRSSQAFGARGARARRPLEAHAILLALRGCLPMAGLEHVSCSMPAILCVYRDLTPGAGARPARVHIDGRDAPRHPHDGQAGRDGHAHLRRRPSRHARREVRGRGGGCRCGTSSVVMHVGAALAAERENSRAVR